MVKVLVVDDEAIITLQLEERLSSLGYKVVGMAASGEEACEKAHRLIPDIVLMDIVMPGKTNGIIAAKQINDELGIPVIFITSYADDKTIEEAKKVYPYGYIVKPFNELELKAAMELALYKKNTEKQLFKNRSVPCKNIIDEGLIDEFSDFIVPASKTILLNNFYQGMILILYSNKEKIEPIFKFSIEHSLNNDLRSLFTYYQSTLPKFFFKEIQKEKLIIYHIKKKESYLLLSNIQKYLDTPISYSDDMNVRRIYFDFSETEEFDHIYEIKKYIFEKMLSGHPISGIIAVNIEKISDEQIQKISEGITRVIVCTEKETSISIANHPYPLESVSIVPQAMVEEIVRKSLEPLILSIFNKPMSGFDIVHEINNRYTVLIPQSRVYSILYELQQHGILEIRTSGKSKLYCPTEKGKKYIKQKVNEFRFTFQHIFGGINNES